MRVRGIHEFLKASGYSARDLARLSGTHESTVHQVKQGRNGAAAFKILRAAEKLGAEVEVQVWSEAMQRRRERIAAEALAGND